MIVGDDAGVLSGRRVVLGVTGGIAAYKAIEVCRRLVDAGAHVAPVLTPAATRFVGPLTFSALASEPVRTSLWDGPEAISHTRLGQQADLVLVVPATARFLGSYAAGISEGLLTATVLATRAPVIVCPAMHTEMWEHPAVQENLDRLRRWGVHTVLPEAGRLAGGDVGSGRLAAPEVIVSAAAAVLSGRSLAEGAPRADLAGRVVLVTAGGTREPIDAVRVITNRSSGKQGHALAEAAAARGAKVVLITTSARPVPTGIEVVAVETAAELEAAVLARSDAADVVVMAAAVADFRPARPSPVKHPKSEGPPLIELEPTPDILAGLGRRRRDGQVLVGFAAETGDLEERARAKLAAKRVDILVANDVGLPGVGFDHDTNAVSILEAGGAVTEVALATKLEVAHAVLDKVSGRLGGSGGTETPGRPARRDDR